MPVGDYEQMDMTAVAVDNYERMHLDVLVCLGGDGTQKNAYRLQKAGLNVVTLPKTIDNDVAGTDVTFGFDTAMSIAAEAIDRLHSTADSHHRVILLEVMGHHTGWLALGAGVAGGADIILIPEIPYRFEGVVEALLNRYRQGKRFSIVCVAEGAVRAGAEVSDATEDGLRPSEKLALEIEERTGLQTRVTVLGHLQRGGTPSAADRLLATRLGTKCVELVDDGVSGVMVAVRGEDCVPVKLKAVAGERRYVPLDHAWIHSARLVGTSFAD
jgi:6-phosphofructokinase 1